MINSISGEFDYKTFWSSFSFTNKTVKNSWDEFSFTMKKKSNKYFDVAPPMIFESSRGLAGEVALEDSTMRSIKKKAEMEASRKFREARENEFNEEADRKLQAFLESEKAKPKVEVTVESKKHHNGKFKPRAEKKIKVVESNHNEARRAKKKEKKVLDKARSEFFQNSSLLFDDSWIISIGQALGMEKPQFHIREIKEKLNLSCVEKNTIAKVEDEITKSEVADLTEEQLEILAEEVKQDDQEIRAVISVQAIEEAEAKRIEEAKEREILEEKKTFLSKLSQILVTKKEAADAKVLEEKEAKAREEIEDLLSIMSAKDRKKYEEMLARKKKEEISRIQKSEEKNSEIEELKNLKMGAESFMKPKKNRLCRSLKLGAEPCTKESCSFLHNLEELKFTPCTHKKCGRVKMVGQGKYVNIGIGCQFIHQNETPSGFFIREGYMAQPVVEIDKEQVVLSPVSSVVEVKVEILNCNAWKEVNSKIYSYPGQEVEEVKVTTSVTRVEPASVAVVNNKTKLCDSFFSGNPCRHGEKCRYAHNTDDLVIRDCPHGRDCLFVLRHKGTFQNTEGKFCKCIHPDESRENYFVRNEISVKPVEKKPECCKTKTKICNSVSQGVKCRHKNCAFAHNENELNIRECTFPECKLVVLDSQGNIWNANPRNKCVFFHKGETKRSYFCRMLSN
jgi:hypothetical protein